MNTIQSPKAIMNAITRTYENNEKEVVRLMKKYLALPKIIGKEKQWHIFLSLLAKDKKFEKDFAELIVKSGEMRNAQTRNVGIFAAVSGLVGGLSNVASTYMETSDAPAKREHEIAMEQMKLQQQTILMQQQQTSAKQKTKTIYIVAGGLGLVAIIGLFIFIKSKKNKA